MDSRFDTQAVITRIRWLKSSYPELTEDADLLISAIEGETDFDKVTDRLAQEAVEARAIADGVNEVIKALMKRRDRYDNKETMLRSCILGLMREAGKRTHVSPAATISLREGARSVAIDNLNALPQGYARTTVTPDKQAIKKSLEAGEDVPGARLEAGPPTITMRTN